MHLSETQTLELPPSADMHVHLRQGAMMELVTPWLRKGGVDTVFVMPNLVPPITTVAAALQYKASLRNIEPNVTYLMSLYLHPSITPDVIAEAAAAGIAGVKMYPQGVTTNSDSGVTSLEAFFPVFEAMEKHDLVLNLHGEVADLSGHDDGVTHEEAFLPTLHGLHERFPKLRIVLEHCTTAAAVDAVRACASTVGATITAHHLYLTTADACDPHAFCKPIPKKPADRDALCRAVVSGDPKFFFGSDSAPHPLPTKQQADGNPPAGVFTQPCATQLVVLALEEAVARGAVAADDVTPARLADFLSRNGRRFYGLPEPDAGAEGIVLERSGAHVVVPATIRSADGSTEVGVSRGGEPIWSLRWVGSAQETRP